MAEITILPFDSEKVDLSNAVLFDEMQLYSPFEEDHLEVLERELRGKLQRSIDAWLETLDDDAVVYDSLTSISVSYNELRWDSGVAVEHIVDHRGHQKYLRVARSLYLEGGDYKIYVGGEEQLSLARQQEQFRIEAIDWVRWFVEDAPYQSPEIVTPVMVRAKEWLEKVSD